MKKIIIIIVCLFVLVGGYVYVAKNVRAPLSALAGETTTTKIGDLVVPITASGLIQPASITQIKSKASGKVIEIPFQIGQAVRKNDLVIRLDKIDEERNVARATAEYDHSEIAVATARIGLGEAKEVGILRAQANLARLTAQQALAQIDLDHKKTLPSNAVNEIELARAKSTLDEAKAAVAAAEADLKQAGIAIELAEKKIDAAEETRKAALRVKEEAEERLKDTSVYSPIDGIVVAQHVEIGELVMSGTTSLTGGTILVELADVSEVYAEVNVDEADIGLVRDLSTVAQPADSAEAELATLPTETFNTDQEVEVTVEAYPEDKFYGVIELISPQSEVIRAIATFKVRIRITSDNRHKLRRVLNTQAQANFTAKSVTNAVLVNYEAMKPNPDGDGYGVYVPSINPTTGRTEPEFVPCKFGVDNRVEVEVIEGLEADQKVYTKLPRKTEKQQKEEAEAEAED